MQGNQIFVTTAPRYYANGLPVIPLRPMQKKPIPQGWSKYCEVMPTGDEQAAWIASQPNANIGLPLGSQSGLVMIDIDTDDEAIKAAILGALAPFPGPWVRVGKKGMAIAYKQPVSGPLKPFKLKDAKTGQMIVECLSTGNQVVLPPSIHPETKQPYVANCDLVDVLDQLVALPQDIELRLRRALPQVTQGTSSRSQRGKTPSGSTHGANGLIEDGRNDEGTRIRARTFNRLRDAGELSPESFTTESWEEFSRVCATGPTGVT
jgi:hypothetical protein